jgi:hypothetical protein
MRRLAALALTASLFGCGDDSGGGGTTLATPTPATPPPPAPPSGAALEGAAGARAVVEAYLAAARVPDEAAMLALGTPQWREKEKAWAKGFTTNIARKGFALKTAEVREPEVSGEEARVSVRAVFVVEGEDDNEGMRFTLVRRDGRWWISDLS